MTKYSHELYSTVDVDENGAEILFTPCCGRCHFYAIETDPYCCRRFPDGIPPAVWRGRKECKSKGYFWIDEDDTEEIERWFESQHQRKRGGF